MYGMPMRVPTRSGLTIELAPMKLDDVRRLADVFSSHHNTANLGGRSALTPDQEEVWLKHTSEDPGSYCWGIYLDDELIGNTKLDELNGRRATSGCAIFDKTQWGKGIITATHHARMYYAVMYWVWRRSIHMSCLPIQLHKRRCRESVMSTMACVFPSCWSMAW